MCMCVCVCARMGTSMRTRVCVAWTWWKLTCKYVFTSANVLAKVKVRIVKTCFCICVGSYPRKGSVPSCRLRRVGVLRSVRLTTKIKMRWLKVTTMQVKEVQNRLFSNVPSASA